MQGMCHLANYSPTDMPGGENYIHVYMGNG